jgi:hypothetical protein
LCHSSQGKAPNLSPRLDVSKPKFLVSHVLCPIFSIAVMAAYLHIKTIAPDLLGSISVALLQNKTDGIIGSSIQ